MAKRTYTVTMSNAGGVLARESFAADDADDMQDAGYAAREIVERMIADAGWLRAGDCIRVREEV